jgi:hypothetical protein
MIEMTPQEQLKCNCGHYEHDNGRCRGLKPCTCKEFIPEPKDHNCEKCGQDTEDESGAIWLRRWNNQWLCVDCFKVEYKPKSRAITGSGFKDARGYFKTKDNTALKIQEIIDGVLFTRSPLSEYGPGYVYDVMHMGNNEYSVTIEHGIVSNHELRLINKRLSTIGFEVDWIGANHIDNKTFLQFFVNLRSNPVCGCTACVADEGEVFQRENR